LNDSPTGIKRDKSEALRRNPTACALVTILSSVWQETSSVHAIRFHARAIKRCERFAQVCEALC
jgi:hypothetical protein